MAFFTVHRAASTFCHRVFRRLSQHVGLTPIDLQGLAYEEGRKVLEMVQESRRPEAVFQPCGYFYGPLRGMKRPQEFPGIHGLRCVVMVRDPRDTLVSLFYASAFSHSIPEGERAAQKQLETRARALEAESVDAFTLGRAEKHRTTYDAYVRFAQEHPAALLVTYEDMVSDFEGWLDRILTFVEWPVSEAVRNGVCSWGDFNVSAENKFAHKRQVTPGDHTRKLQPETIERLNTIYGRLLRDLNYT